MDLEAHAFKQCCALSIFCVLYEMSWWLCSLREQSLNELVINLYEDGHSLLSNSKEIYCFNPLF